jgi:thiol:disulfide interchange protein
MRRLGLLLLPLVLAAAGCRPENESVFRKLTYEDALATAKAENKTVMIDFFADWCGPCKQLDAKTFSNAHVRDFLTERTIPVRINVDKHGPLAQQHSVSGIPCVVFLDGEGRELGRIVGFVPPSQFLTKARGFVK